MPHTPEAFTRRQAIYLAGLTLLHRSLHVSSSRRPITLLDAHDTLTPEQWARLHDALVIMHKSYPTDQVKPRKHGSGFHAGEGTFLTNRHVLFDDVDSREAVTRTSADGISMTRPEMRSIHPYQLTRFNRVDLALAHAYEAPATTLPLTPHIPGQFEPVYSYAYQPDPCESTSTLSAYPIRARVLGTVYKFFDGSHLPQKAFVLATDLDKTHYPRRFEHGSSGSPIVDRWGHVFAVQKAILTPPDAIDRALYGFILGVEADSIRSLAFAVPLHTPAIRSYLESHGIHYLP